MITIYKNKREIPQGMEYVELNDVFFNQNTVMKLDDRAEEIIRQIDGAQLIGKYKILSKFHGVTLDVDHLSTGCKTVLNVLYNTEKVFCMKECGDNALEMLYRLEQGYVYSDYAMIPLELERIRVFAGAEHKIIDDYEELKEWWNHEK